LGYAAYKIQYIQEPLITFVKEHISGKLEIKSAKVQFFPTRLILQKIQIFSLEDKKPSIHIEEAQLAFKTIPLLSEKLDIELKLLKPRFEITQSKNGFNNLENIFSPLLAKQGGATDGTKSAWWKKLLVSKLIVDE